MPLGQSAVSTIRGVSDGDRNLPPSPNTEESATGQGGSAQESGGGPGDNSPNPGSRSKLTDRIDRPVDPVEAALSESLLKAVHASAFDLAEKIVAELEVRRRDLQGVVDAPKPRKPATSS